MITKVQYISRLQAWAEGVPESFIRTTREPRPRNNTPQALGFTLATPASFHTVSNLYLMKCYNRVLRWGDVTFKRRWLKESHGRQDNFQVVTQDVRFVYPSRRFMASLIQTLRSLRLGDCQMAPFKDDRPGRNRGCILSMFPSQDNDE
jgi:hypothetical protein